MEQVDLKLSSVLILKRIELN